MRVRRSPGIDIRRPWLRCAGAALGNGQVIGMLWTSISTSVVEHPWDVPAERVTAVLAEVAARQAEAAAQ